VWEAKVARLNKKTAPGRPMNVPGARRIRKLAVRGKLSTKRLEKFIEQTRKLGYPIKYTKPIGFKRRR
tara:strand:+ start:101 stop:304 length:204 start_codon:yes stop_codon:yes gene_type:complete